MLALVLEVALECYQAAVTGRYGSIIDILLNSAGTVPSLVAALFLL